MKVILKDGSSLEVENGVSVLEVAKTSVKDLQEQHVQVK